MTLAFRKRAPLPPRRRNDNGRLHSRLLFNTYKARHDVLATGMGTLRKINDLVYHANHHRDNGKKWRSYESFCEDIDAEPKPRLRRMWQLLCGKKAADVYANVP
ncbi:hypothetical protein CYMTET_54416 [Cymbomonas tetramitiformis]|uniref:Uncharacterized protein n=1 Tax=Cymbomonas tetramitiformis TaxID=36881 RepID=A0AAE0BGE6_9CHLO|nr:hypothetical protein CYMTET_54416 [Cymbomonas tetramitiformis]